MLECLWYFWLKYTKLRTRPGEQGEFILLTMKRRLSTKLLLGLR